MEKIIEIIALGVFIYYLAIGVCLVGYVVYIFCTIGCYYDRDGNIREDISADEHNFAVFNRYQVDTAARLFVKGAVYLLRSICCLFVWFLMRG